jgi:hypothetical protein
LAALTIKVRTPESDRPHQRLDGAVLGTAGRPRLPTLGGGRCAWLHRRPMGLLPQPLCDGLGPFLPACKDGLGQLFQGRLGFLHVHLQCIQPLIQAVVQTLPNLCAPLGVAKLFERKDRGVGHRPVLQMSKVLGIMPPSLFTYGAGSCVLKNRECSHVA